MVYPQFQRQAVLVKPLPKLSGKFGVRWEVTTQDALDLQDPGRTETFDAVIVANGKFSVPSIPTLPGMDTFQGQVMHSHDYRHPEKFSNQVLVLLGANMSGQDIAIGLSAVAKK
ncbi:flavin-containing monooxygenase, partial [Plakobranchus ocellatus]